MVNSGKFAQRLQKILDHYDLSAAAFADSIEVGRSSISHILSERNKPSLDFVLKIVQNYPEVELYWLLNGKGDFPKSSEKPEQKEKLKSAEKLQVPKKSDKNKNSPTSLNLPAPSEKAIKKIVIFYSDGTFDAFEN